MINGFLTDSRTISNSAINPIDEKKIAMVSNSETVFGFNNIHKPNTTNMSSPVILTTVKISFVIPVDHTTKSYACSGILNKYQTPVNNNKGKATRFNFPKTENTSA